MERHLHLFSDALMYSKYSSKPLVSSTSAKKSCSSIDKLECCCIMPIKHCSVEIIFGKISPDNGALFQIRCKHEYFFFYSKSSVDVDDWIREINKAKE